MTTSFTINSATIDVVNSYEELVDEINQEATGVTAVLNGDNTITLFNDDGADIAFSAAQGATDVGFTARCKYNIFGMIALENVDGSAVSIEIGVVENGYVGDTGAGTDLISVGFQHSQKWRSDRCLSTNDDLPTQMVLKSMMLPSVVQVQVVQLLKPLKSMRLLLCMVL